MRSVSKELLLCLSNYAYWCRQNKVIVHRKVDVQTVVISSNDCE